MADDMRVSILIVMDEQGVASTTRLTTQGVKQVEQAAEGADRMGRRAKGSPAHAEIDRYRRTGPPCAPCIQPAGRWRMAGRQW